MIWQVWIKGSLGVWWLHSQSIHKAKVDATVQWLKEVCAEQNVQIRWKSKEAA